MSLVFFIAWIVVLSILLLYEISKEWGGLLNALSPLVWFSNPFMPIFGVVYIVIIPICIAYIVDFVLNHIKIV